jgi:hypothetical protein
MISEGQFGGTAVLIPAMPAGWISDGWEQRGELH